MKIRVLSIKQNISITITIILIILLSSVWSHADQSIFPTGKSTVSYKLKSFNCELTEMIMPPELPRPPEYVLKCQVGDKSFTKTGYGAQQLYESDDGKFLLGLSNSGFHQSTYWILDSNGEVIRHASHDRNRISYCRWSVTVSREWVSKSPKPQFIIENGQLIDVIVDSCKGTRVSLIKRPVESQR